MTQIYLAEGLVKKVEENNIFRTEMEGPSTP